jgi:SAM-dependent methyltransferase
MIDYGGDIDDMTADLVPSWARNLLCEPDTLAPLQWNEHVLTSETGKTYRIEGGIPIFHNEEGSYQNRDAIRPRVDRQNPTVRAFEDRPTIFDQYADRLKDKVIVDMCSGGGMPSYYLAAKYGCRVISVEQAYNAIKHYGDLFRDYYGVKDDQVVRVCADAACLPVRPETVDAVVGSSWVHHFGDQVAVLRGAYRVLKPGGLLLAHNEGVAGLLARGTADEDRYTRPAVYRRSLNLAGFVNVQVLPWSRRYWLARWVKASVDLVGRRPAAAQ